MYCICTHLQIVYPGKWKPYVGDYFKHKLCETHSCQLPKEYLWSPWDEWSKKCTEDPLGWNRNTVTMGERPLSPKIFLRMMLPWQNQWILQRSNVLHQYCNHNRNCGIYLIKKGVLENITKEEYNETVKGVMYCNLFYKLSSFPLFVNQAQFVLFTITIVWCCCCSVNWFIYRLSSTLNKRRLVTLRIRKCEYLHVTKFYVCLLQNVRI